MMILSLCFGGPEEADHSMCIKGISRSPKAPLRQASFLCPFCWWDAIQHDRSDPFIEALFWRSAPLLEQMIIVGSFSAFALGLWHTSCCLSEDKGDENSGHPLP